KSERTKYESKPTNLFSYEASFLRIFESLPSALAKWFGLARKVNDQQPMTNDSNFVGDHTAGVHPFPSRTRKLSPAGPIVLHAKVCGRVGHRRHKIKGHQQKCWWLFLFGWNVWRVECVGRAPSPDRIQAVSVRRPSTA